MTSTVDDVIRPPQTTEFLAEIRERATTAQSALDTAYGHQSDTRRWALTTWAADHPGVTATDLAAALDLSRQHLYKLASQLEVTMRRGAGPRNADAEAFLSEARRRNAVAAEMVAAAEQQMSDARLWAIGEWRSGRPATATEIAAEFGLTRAGLARIEAAATAT